MSAEEKAEIAEAFYAKGALDEGRFWRGLRLRSWLNPTRRLDDKEGERALGLMRWGFKLPKHFFSM